MTEEQTLDLLELIQRYKTEIISGGSIVLFLGLILMGGVLASGILLGLISSVGFAMLFYESRDSVPWLYDIMVKHPFWTDVISTIALGAMFGTSVNGLIAAAVFGVMNTVILMVTNKYDKRAGSPTTSLKSHFSNFISKVRGKKVQQTDIMDAEFVEVTS